MKCEDSCNNVILESFSCVPSFYLFYFPGFCCCNGSYCWNFNHYLNHLFCNVVVPHFPFLFTAFTSNSSPEALLHWLHWCCLWDNHLTAPTWNCWLLVIWFNPVHKIECLLYGMLWLLISAHLFTILFLMFLCNDEMKSLITWGWVSFSEGSLKILPALYPIYRHRHDRLILSLSHASQFLPCLVHGGGIWKAFLSFNKSSSSNGLCWSLPPYGLLLLISVWFHSEIMSTYSADLVNFIDPFLELSSVCSIIGFDWSKHSVICFVLFALVSSLNASCWLLGLSPWFLKIWIVYWPDLLCGT